MLLLHVDNQLSRYNAALEEVMANTVKQVIKIVSGIDS